MLWFSHGYRERTWCEWHPDGSLERIAVYQQDQLMRGEFDPPGTCPVVHGMGAHHLDPRNTDLD